MVRISSLLWWRGVLVSLWWGSVVATLFLAGGVWLADGGALGADGLGRGGVLLDGGVGAGGLGGVGLVDIGVLAVMGVSKKGVGGEGRRWGEGRKGMDLHVSLWNLVGLGAGAELVGVGDRGLVEVDGGGGADGCVGAVWDGVGSCHWDGLGDVVVRWDCDTRSVLAKSKVQASTYRSW